MAIAKVFRSGNSEAVRLSKEFRLDATEIEIPPRGGEIMLRELSGAFQLLCALPDDVLADRRDDPSQPRKGL